MLSPGSWPLETPGSVPLASSHEGGAARGAVGSAWQQPRSRSRRGARERRAGAVIRSVVCVTGLRTEGCLHIYSLRSATEGLPTLQITGAGTNLVAIFLVDFPGRFMKIQAKNEKNTKLQTFKIKHGPKIIEHIYDHKIFKSKQKKSAFSRLIFCVLNFCFVIHEWVTKSERSDRANKYFSSVHLLTDPV